MENLPVNAKRIHPAFCIPTCRSQLKAFYTKATFQNCAIHFVSSMNLKQTVRKRLQAFKLPKSWHLRHICFQKKKNKKKKEICSSPESLPATPQSFFIHKIQPPLKLFLQLQHQ